jgi:hypothetical protein
MRRLSISVSVLLIAIVGIIAAGRSFSPARAQDSASLAGNPLVGSWAADVDANDPNNPPSLFVFTSDGVYTQFDIDGTATVGTWKATGANTAEMTSLSYQAGKDGEFGGTLTIRASITVSADGQRFTAPYTLEFTPAGGQPSGQAGPGTATGTRIAVETMGTPAMTIPQLFGGGQSQATPTS